MELLATVPLLIMDDLGMRKLAPTAAEELLEIVMRRHERASTLLTSNRPVEDWGKLLGDSAAVTAMLDRLLHHGHILKCGPRSWRPKRTCPSRRKWAKTTKPRLHPLAGFDLTTEDRSRWSWSRTNDFCERRILRKMIVWMGFASQVTADCAVGYRDGKN
jgi:hypothetical protein